MSLDWNIQGIDNWKEVCFDEWDEEKGSGTLSARTESLIFCTMFVGMGAITEDNWQTFYKRMYAWEKVNGAIMYRGKEGGGIEYVPVEPEEVYSHIGLKTNAGRETDTAFSKKLVNSMMEEASDALKRSELVAKS